MRLIRHTFQRTTATGLESRTFVVSLSFESTVLQRGLREKRMAESSVFAWYVRTDSLTLGAALPLLPNGLNLLYFL